MAIGDILDILTIIFLTVLLASLIPPTLSMAYSKIIDDREYIVWNNMVFEKVGLYNETSVSRIIDKAYSISLNKGIKYQLTIPANTIVYVNTTQYKSTTIDTILLVKENMLKYIVVIVKPYSEQSTKLSYMVKLRTLYGDKGVPILLVFTLSNKLSSYNSIVDNIYIPLIKHLYEKINVVNEYSLIKYTDNSMFMIDRNITGLVIAKALLYDTLYIVYRPRTWRIQDILYNGATPEDACNIAYVLLRKYGIESYIIEYSYENELHYLVISDYISLSSFDKIYRLYNIVNGKVYSIFYADYQVFAQWPLIINTLLRNAGYSSIDPKLHNLLARIPIVEIKRVYPSIRLDKLRVYELYSIKVGTTSYVLVPGVIAGTVGPVNYCRVNEVYCIGASCILLNLMNSIKTGNTTMLEDLLDIIDDEIYFRDYGLQDVYRIYYPWLTKCGLQGVYIVNQTTPPTEEDLNKTPITLQYIPIPLSPGVLIPLSLIIAAASISLIIYFLHEARKGSSLKRGKQVELKKKIILEGIESPISKTISVRNRHLVVLYFTKILALLKDKVGDLEKGETFREYGYRVKIKLGDRVHQLYMKALEIYEKARYTNKYVGTSDLYMISSIYRELEEILGRIE